MQGLEACQQSRQTQKLETPTLKNACGHAAECKSRAVGREKGKPTRSVCNPRIGEWRNNKNPWSRESTTECRRRKNFSELMMFCGAKTGHYKAECDVKSDCGQGGAPHTLAGVTHCCEAVDCFIVKISWRNRPITQPAAVSGQGCVSTECP